MIISLTPLTMIHTHTPTSISETRCTILRDIVRSEPGTLRAAIAEAALQSGDVESFFRDAIHGGDREPAIVTEIVTDGTHGFFHRYRDEIEAFQVDYEAETGDRLTVDGDERRFVAWMTFAQTTLLVVRDEMGLE